MEIILLERIEKLGGIGDVVTVKNGFARNFLLPNNKALRANEANRKLFEANRSKIEADNAERRTDAEGRAKDIDGKQVVLIRQASNTGQLYGSVSVRDIVDERTAAIYELGLANLSLSPAGFEGEQQLRRFESGLIDLKQRQNLFAQRADAVEIAQGVLYRARLSIPAQVPVGRYTAETYLISRGRVLAVASRDIDIAKTGFDRFVANAAAHYGLLYGIVAVAISLAMGWTANWLFNRR